MKLPFLKLHQSQENNSTTQPTSTTPTGEVHTPKYAYEPAATMKLERSKQPTIQKKIGNGVEFNVDAQSPNKVQVERTSVDELSSDATAWLNYWY